MELFETLVMILLAALALLVLARRMNVPYPTLLALGGLGFATLPVAPEIEVEPHLALALFIAPALLHAAYHSSPRGLRRYWFPLVSLAVVAVLLTAAAVAAVGVTLGGLPFAAALALGAIVAPPDAAAADAVLGEVDLPRRGHLLLQGESLLNDATALLLFGLAVGLATGSEEAGTPASLALAAPGGVALGLAVAWIYLRVAPYLAGTLGASIADFAVTFGLWLLAELLHLSPVLAVVALGMTMAAHGPQKQAARDRVQARAVWSAVVLVLNAVAFTLMGLQAHAVVERLPEGELGAALGFSAAVLATVLAVRIAWVFALRGLEVLAMRAKIGWIPEPPPWQASLAVSWAGMRGLLTLATAFALPGDMPGRDLIVLAAFTVVIGTLVIQGLTLGPLIRRLKITDDKPIGDKVAEVRAHLIETGLDAIKGKEGDVPHALRVRYGGAAHVAQHGDDPQDPSDFDRLHLKVITRQRDELFAMRRGGKVAEDVYRRLLEELDWSEIEARSFEANLLRAQ